MKLGTCLAAVALLAACSHSSSGRSTSTVTGTVDATTFAAPPTAVEATDETGARVHADIGAGGSFQLLLPKAHTYRLTVSAGSGAAEPVVFPRGATVSLATTVRVSSGAATVALGMLRHVASAPAGGFSPESATVSCDNGGPNQDNQQDGECVDGKDAKTGAACSDTEETADPSRPMTVAEKSAPDDVGGCEDGSNDGESNDD